MDLKTLAGRPLDKKEDILTYARNLRSVKGCYCLSGNIGTAVWMDWEEETLLRTAWNYTLAGVAGLQGRGEGRWKEDYEPVKALRCLIR
jgi:hypothetical protein